MTANNEIRQMLAAIREYLMIFLSFFSLIKSKGKKIMSAKNLKEIAIEKEIANRSKFFLRKK